MSKCLCSSRVNPSKASTWALCERLVEHTLYSQIKADLMSFCGKRKVRPNGVKTRFLGRVKFHVFFHWLKITSAAIFYFKHHLIKKKLYHQWRLLCSSSSSALLIEQGIIKLQKVTCWQIDFYRSNLKIPTNLQTLSAFIQWFLSILASSILSERHKNCFISARFNFYCWFV